MSEATDDTVLDTQIARLPEAISQAAMAVHGLPNRAAWRQIPVILSGDRAISPAAPSELRPLIWRVRRALAVHVKKSPALSEEELHRAVLEIAATVV